MNHYNNPFNFLSKIKPDFDNFGIELRSIRYDDIFGGSWLMKFELDNGNYQIIWDSRENWLQIDKITKKDALLI